MADYRSGKRVGYIALAQRAGSGDIIGWSHLPQQPVNAPSPKRVVTQPPTLPTPPPSSQPLPSAYNTDISSNPSTFVADRGPRTSQPVVDALLSSTESFDNVETSPIARRPTSSHRAGISYEVVDDSLSSVGYSHQPIPVVMSPTSSRQYDPSQPVRVQPSMLSPRLNLPTPFDRPGSSGYASMYSLRDSVDVLSSVPFSQGEGSMSDDATIHSMVARSTARVRDKVLSDCLDGRKDFVEVIAARQLQLKVVRHLLISGGPTAALSHIGRLGDVSVAVDVLKALVGVGMPKWPQFTDVTWLVDVTPVLIKLLQSQYEDYVMVVLNVVGSVVTCLQPLHNAITVRGDGVPVHVTPQKIRDMVEVSMSCMNALKEPLRELCDVDGRVGKLAKSRLTSVITMTHG